MMKMILVFILNIIIDIKMLGIFVILLGLNLLVIKLVIKLFNVVFIN